MQIGALSTNFEHSHNYEVNALWALRGDSEGSHVADVAVATYYQQSFLTTKFQHL